MVRRPPGIFRNSSAPASSPGTARCRTAESIAQREWSKPTVLAAANGVNVTALDPSSVARVDADLRELRL